MFVVIVIENLFCDPQLNTSRAESDNAGIRIGFRRLIQSFLFLKLGLCYSIIALPTFAKNYTGYTKLKQILIKNLNIDRILESGTLPASHMTSC